MNNILNPDPNYGKDLSPKKFLLHGNVAFGREITFSANAFQELPTAYTVKGLLDLVIDFFGIQAEATDINEAMRIYLDNPKLQIVKSAVVVNGEKSYPVTIENNGGRYPSCSIQMELPNPMWTDGMPFTDKWSVQFEYRKGKWTINENVDHVQWVNYSQGTKRTTTATTAAQAHRLADLIRATRSEI